MYDAAIIGSGPAGLSAALNLKLHERSIIWFGSRDQSAKVEKSEKIANYPGVGFISGTELNERFDKHRRQMGLEISDHVVTGITQLKDHFALLAENELYQAKTLLLAIGVVTAKGFEVEKEFLGRGVSYCATCDGFLYKNKTIAVYCEDKRYEHEVEYLACLAANVYLSVGYRDCELDIANVELLQKPIRTVYGEKRITGITLTDGAKVPVDGLFCLRGAVAPGTLLPGLTMQGVHIAVDRQQATNLPGCFAAGDCTGRPYQIAKAVGEGNVAAASMVEYLSKLNREG